MVVKGPKKDPLFEWLKKSEKGHQEIGWNFEKFLVDRTGKLVGRFSSASSSDDKGFLSALNAALAK